MISVNEWFVFDVGLDDKTCNKLKRHASKKWEVSAVDTQKGTTDEERKTGLKGDYKSDSKQRISDVAWTNDQWVYDLIWPYMLGANKNAGWKFDIDHHETPQFTKYSGGGFYGWHIDGMGDHNAKYEPFVRGLTPVKLRKDGNIPHSHTQNSKYFYKVRKLSVTINLTDPSTYDGGDLMFDLGENDGGKITASEAREQGSVIVFPSFLYHCVSPITKGTRYSLVNWALGRPFK